MDPHTAAESEDLVAASRLSRLLALALDLGLAAALGAGIHRFYQLQTFEFGSHAMVAAYVLILMAAGAMLFAQVYLLVVFGQTIGKWALGIRLITPEGFVPTLWRILGRRLLPILALILVAHGVLQVRYAGALAVLLIHSSNRYQRNYMSNSKS